MNQAAPRLAYVGSLGPQYRPLSMLALVKAMRERLGGLTLTIFTADIAAARSLLSENGLEKARWISCESLTPEALAERLPEYDGGLALRAESLSMSAVAPVKIGDYLMAGLPIIGTAGIGDVEELIAADVMLPVNGEGDAGRAVDWLTNRVGSQMKIVRRKCRELGERLFSLERSVALYDEAIARVKRPGARTADARAIA